MSDHPPVSPTPSPESVASPPPRRRKRWWLRLLIALPILLIALIVLAPTLLSLGAIRSMIVPSVSKSVAPNGSVGISNWSLGWLGGQRIDGITLYDDNKAPIAHLNIKTDASLLGLARGKYAIGDTTIDGDFDIRIDPDTSRVNILNALGLDQPAKSEDKPPVDQDKKSPSPQTPKDSTLPIDLASVNGTVTLNLKGTISAANGDNAAIPFTKLETGKVVVDLNNIENGIGLDGAIALVVADKPATLTFKGKADAIEKNVLLTDPNQIGADLVAVIDGIDLAIVKTILLATGATDFETTELAGLLKGKIVVDWQRGGAGVIRAEDNLGIERFAFGGPQLKGDTFRSQRVDFPIHISRAAGSDEVKIESLGIRSDVATLSVTGSVSQKAIANLMEGRAPHATSTVRVQTDVPSVAAVMKMLPNLARLQEGVEVRSGSIQNLATVDLIPDGAKLTQSLRLAAAGSANGKPIKLDEIKLDSSADLRIAEGKSIDLGSVRALSLQLAAPFATINANGVPEKVQATGNVDLTRFYDEVSQFVDLGDLDLKGTAGFKLNTAGLPTDAAAPLGLAADFSLKNLIIASGGKSYLNNETITGVVDLWLKQEASNAKTITFKKLAVKTDSTIFDLAMQGDSAWVTIAESGAFGGEAIITFGAALDRLLAPFMADIDPQYRLTRGRIGTTLTLTADRAKDQYTLVTSGEIGRLTVGSLLKDETLKFGTTTHIPTDLTSLQTTFDVASTFTSLKGEAALHLPKDENASPLQIVQKATWTGDVSSLPKLHALLMSLSPAEPVILADGTKLPPMVVESGTVTFKGDISRDADTLSVNVAVPAIANLVVSRGKETYRQREPITFAMSADVATDPSKPTPAEQLKRVVVSKLEANAPGLAKLTMPKAIELTNLDQPTPKAVGTVQFEGQLQQVGELLAVVNGVNPMPVSGQFGGEQNISTAGSVIALVGNAAVQSLQPTGPDATPLPDQLQTLVIINDLSIDPKTMRASIKRIDVNAPKARDVLSFRLAGNISELGTQNTFEGMKATLLYDLAQLWPVVQPFVDPTGESIGKVEELIGRHEKVFTVAGRYPSVDKNGMPIEFKNAIRSLEVAGDIQIDRANLSEKGIVISDVSIPITLKGGVASIAFPDGSTPKPFKINDGEGNLGGLKVDLTAGEPLLVNVKDYRLLTNVRLNPVLSTVAGKFANPLFPNATNASGLVSVRMSTKRLYLGPALQTQNSGWAAVSLSISEMEIGNPIGEQMFGSVINKVAGAFGRGGMNTDAINNFTGEIREAIFTLDRGVVTQDMTFMIGSKQDDPKKQPKLYPMRFTGDVTLANLGMNLRASVPLQVIKDQSSADWLKYLPDEWPISFAGTTTEPKVNPLGDPGRLTAEILAKVAAERALKGGDNKSGSSGGIEDILRQIPGLGGDKKETPRDQPVRDDDRSDAKAREEAAAEQRRKEAEERRRREAERNRRNDEPRQSR